ncbi:HTH-type transcriptional regulator ArgP [Pseudomonas fluorescens]|uniref:LysR family transcriptional regulator n=1 Tax=Pseudomonas fluorescens TaxID=294 RepID=UPI0012588A12|nr:LysR family transcriptional regulator [Pseudomonas fluorescens]CAG8863649.1 HTH-type transcriptional regulator ArgP [Pseudomonas fluorescens]VVP85602.1 HTH-type transcriptional regulator ArgP [Pseudomonas fluorescens]
MATIAKANRSLFDLDLLRAIVVVADCGSFTTAATRLHSTQSTVSQKVRRLEEMVGHRLLLRGNRDVLPTDAGQTLLGYARHMLALNDQMLEALAGATVGITVRLGVPEDFVGGRTTNALSAFSREHPQVKLEVTSGLCRDLSQSYDNGELDLVLLKQKRNAREGVGCWPEQLQWIDSAKTPAFELDPIPLVTFPPRGLYRDDMITAIEGMGRRWRISFTSSSMSGIQAAVADGMGISLLPPRAATREHRVLASEQGLPVVDSYEIVIVHRPTADLMVKALAEVLTGLLAAHEIQG